MRVKVFLLVQVALAVAVLCQGCWVVVAGAGAAGAVAYAKGDLQAVESHDVDAVYAATKKAIADIGLVVVADSKTEVVARDSSDRKITIRLTPAAENATRLSIRVGVFGDETMSNFIYGKIHDNLR